MAQQASPTGPPVVITPKAESDTTFSFLGEDPVISLNEGRIQVLEQALLVAERHAAATVERQLEQEETLRNLVSTAAAAASQAARADHQLRANMA